MPSGVPRQCRTNTWGISAEPSQVHTALRLVPEETVFQSHDAPLLSRRVRAFLDREFPDRWIEGGGGGQFSDHLVFRIWLLWLCLLGVCDGRCLSRKVQNVNELHHNQSALSMKCVQAPGEELNIVLKCIMPLVVPILTSI